MDLCELTSVMPTAGWVQDLPQHRAHGHQLDE